MTLGGAVILNGSFLLGTAVVDRLLGLSSRAEQA